MKKIIAVSSLLVGIIFLTGCNYQQTTEVQPTINEDNIPLCNSYSVDMCPAECVVCPPCIYCSSISCQTEEFCKDMGIDKDWYESIKSGLNGLIQ